MQLRWTLVAAALAAAAITAPAQADPVADLIVQAGDTAYAAVAGLDRTVDRSLDSAVIVESPTTPREVRVLGSADSVQILDWGSGASVSYGGVMGTLWDCSHTTTAGGSVLVTCTPKAGTNIDWSCGVMNVAANVYSRPIDVYDHARATLAEVLSPASRSADAGPNVPDPRPRQWGQAAGVVSCDGFTLGTAQADKDHPTQTATTTMGAVTTLTCEARRTPWSATAPVAAYAVTCIDPANPTSL